MKNVLDGLFTALSLYSVIPVPRTEWNRDSTRYALCFLPLVGLITGVLELLWFTLCARYLPLPMLYAAVAALLPVLVSGGIHMDGFIDTSDAIACHGVREKKLEVLRDPHVGAFGVLWCAGYLLLSFALWYHLFGGARLLPLAAIGFVASRCLNALSIALFPTARHSGLVHLFASTADKRSVAASNGITLAAMLSLAIRVSPVCGTAAAAACAGYFLLHRRFCIRDFGGNTGDLAGFLLQNVELLILVFAVAGGYLMTKG